MEWHLKPTQKGTNRGLPSYRQPPRKPLQPYLISSPVAFLYSVSVCEAKREPPLVTAGFSIKGKSGCQLGDLFLDLTKIISAVFERLGNQTADGAHFLNAHTPRGQSGGTQADTAGNERALLFKGNSVLVDSNPHLIEKFLRLLASEAFSLHVNQEKVGVRSTGNKREAFCCQRFSQNLGVFHHCPLVSLEFGLKRFQKRHRFGCNHMH